MNNVLAIAGRQFRSYFNGPVAYVVIALSLLIVGFLFWEPFFLMNVASVRELFRFLSWTMVFGVPAITMGTLAEEQRSGTLELLITTPVRESDVILGKFLGALGLVAILLLGTLPYPLSVSTLGNLAWGPVLTGYLGIFLQGAAMVAIGILFSSITDNQVVALFLTIFVLLLSLIAGFYLAVAPAALTTLIEWLTLDFHRESFGRGVVDSRDIVYFLSVAGFSLMLAFRALESRRWS